MIMLILCLHCAWHSVAGLCAVKRVETLLKPRQNKNTNRREDVRTSHNATASDPLKPKLAAETTRPHADEAVTATRECLGINVVALRPSYNLTVAAAR